MICHEIRKKVTGCKKRRAGGKRCSVSGWGIGIVMCSEKFRNVQELFDCFRYGKSFPVTFVISTAKRCIFKQILAIQKNLNAWIERKRVARVVYHAVIVVRRLNQPDRKDVRRDPDLIKRKIGGWAKRIETGNVHSNQIKIEMFIQHFNIGVQIIIGKTADFQTDSTYFFEQRN